MLVAPGLSGLSGTASSTAMAVAGGAAAGSAATGGVTASSMAMAVAGGTAAGGAATGGAAATTARVFVAATIRNYRLVTSICTLISESTYEHLDLLWQAPQHHCPDAQDY